jgi:hypothetical protein
MTVVFDATTSTFCQEEAALSEADDGAIVLKFDAGKASDGVEEEEEDVTLD